MPDYKKMYHTLFNEITTAIQTLQAAQQATEEIYIAEKDEPIPLSPKAPRDK